MSGRLPFVRSSERCAYMCDAKNLDRYYTVPECKRLARKARTAMYALINDRTAADSFPEPFQIGRDYLFLRDEVDAWLARREAKRGLAPRRKPCQRTESVAVAVAAATGTGSALIATKPYVPRIRKARAA